MLPINLISAAVGGIVAVVTLSGETVVSTATQPADATAAISIESDGTVDRITSQGGTQQVDTATDWVIPNSEAPTSYDVRITNVVWQSSGDGESFDIEAASENTWIALTSDRVWQIKESSSSGTKEVDFTVEIRFIGDQTVATGSYTLRAITQV